MGWTLEINDTNESAEFQDIPDDTYDAVVVEVEGPIDGTNFDGNPEKQFIVTFELLPTAQQVDYGCAEGATRKSWIPFTANAQRGSVHPKSNLHALLSALDYDLSAPLKLDTDDWLDKRCRVLITHSEKGNPKVSKIFERRKKLVKAEAKAPVAAGGRRLADRLQPSDEDED